MSASVDKVIGIARAEVGYLEKSASVYKKDHSVLDKKKEGAGTDNYTKYARDLYPSLQGQPWCDMFVDWCFVKAFGEVKARELLCGGFSAYTPISAQYYKDKKQWYGLPERGDQVFFKNSVRICHTGIVTTVSDDMIYTIEGNTSNSSAVIANGGMVCEKSYPLSHVGIAGFGRPNWVLVEEYKVGWHHDNNGWWYADTKSTYLKNCWDTINGHRYYFNKDGYAVTNWQEINNKWYYFEPRAGHPLECALYVTDESGAQDIGVF